MTELRGTFHALPWIRDMKLTATKKSVLYALASRIGHDNKCTPSQPRLALDAGVGERSVRTHLSELEEMGLIRRTKRYRESGQGRTSDEIELCIGAERYDDQPVDDVTAVAGGDTEGGTIPANFAGGIPATTRRSTGNHASFYRKPASGEHDRELPENKKKRSDAAAVAAVFDEWKLVTSHPRAKLTPERRRVIQARLSDGYTASECVAAVRGWRHSPFHRGENDRGAVYDDLTLILRNGEHLEKFANLEAKAARSTGKGSGSWMDRSTGEAPGGDE